MGGRFPREEYAQIFRDLALLMGNPNGDNLNPGGEHLPPGVRPDDPSVVGDLDAVANPADGPPLQPIDIVKVTITEQ